MAGAGLYLDEYERVPIFCNQVELTDGRADVARDDGVTERAEMILRQRLTASAEQ
jgi:hypothetical protein